MPVLAEALAERKDLVNRIGRLDDEIATRMVVEENDDQAKARELVNELDSELVGALNKLEQLENTIRAKNSEATVRFEGREMTLSEAVVLRDRIKTEFNAAKTIASHVDDAISPSRSYRGYERRKTDEIRFVALVAPKELQAKTDALAKRLRTLDAEIQKVNWSFEI